MALILLIQDKGTTMEFAACKHKKDGVLCMRHPQTRIHNKPLMVETDDHIKLFQSLLWNAIVKIGKTLGNIVVIRLD